MAGNDLIVRGGSSVAANGPVARHGGIPRVMIEEGRIIFRNFAGREGQYNREGDRNFGAIIPDENVALQMQSDGWNVKQLKQREPEDPITYWVPVAVSYRHRPPRVVMVTSRGRTHVPEDMIDMIDYADIRKVDMLLNPYSYNVNGRSGVKAYLHALYVHINEDELELKYADIPEVDLDGRLLQSSIGPTDDELGIEDAEIVDDEDE